MTTKTVLILGAGAVRAAAGRKPVAKRPPLDRDFFEIAQKVWKRWCERICEYLNEIVGDYSTEALKSLEESTTCLYLKALDSKAKSIPHLAFLAQLKLLAR